MWPFGKPKRTGFIETAASARQAAYKDPMLRQTRKSKVGNILGANALKTGEVQYTNTNWLARVDDRVAQALLKKLQSDFSRSGAINFDEFYDAILQPKRNNLTEEQRSEAVQVILLLRKILLDLDATTKTLTEEEIKRVDQSVFSKYPGAIAMIVATILTGAVIGSGGLAAGPIILVPIILSAAAADHATYLGAKLMLSKSDLNKKRATLKQTVGYLDNVLIMARFENKVPPQLKGEVNSILSKYRIPGGSQRRRKSRNRRSTRKARR